MFWGGWYGDKNVFVSDDEILSAIAKLPDYEYTPTDKAMKRVYTRRRRNTWDYDACKREAEKYLTRSEFKKKSQSAYNAAKDHGWLDEFIRPEHRPKGYWNNKERVLSVTLLCKNSRDLNIKFPGAYSNAVRKGWLKDLVYKDE